MLNATPGAPEGSRLPFHGAGASHVGHVRSRNEDAWALAPDVRLAVVADGMGGHPAGDVASRIAVEAFTRSVESSDHSSPDGGGTKKDSEIARGGWMAEAVLRAHGDIRAHIDADPETEGMGTTLTGLHLSPTGRWTIGHVGDSRAYRLHGGELEALTRDQSPLRDAIESGKLSPEDARRHPWAHVLSQAVGTPDGIEPEVLTGTAGVGDVFLLCSDGLTKVLTEDEIAAILTDGTVAEGERAEMELESVADSLIEATLERGAPDNVTVVLVSTDQVSRTQPTPPGTDRPRSPGAGR